MSRTPPVLIVILALALGAANAAASVLAVALAIPGSGEPGAGFRVIAGTFAVGVLATLGVALAGARATRRGRQWGGLALQLLTVPLCVALAAAILWATGIDAL